MGLDVNRFKGPGSVDEELLCPICSGVLESPVQAPACEHAFCFACIREWLSRGHSTCPLDRIEFTLSQLKPVPRILKNLLARLEISCDYAEHGCGTFSKLEMLANHLRDCPHNPKKPVSCLRGCGLAVPKDEMKDHNCLRELRNTIQSHELKLSQIERTLTDFRILLEDSTSVDAHLSSEDAASSVPRRPILPPLSRSRTESWSVAAVATEDNNHHHRARGDESAASEQWYLGLPLAKVTRWGGIISTPDAELQALIRRSLADSGCPDADGSILDDLMANAHERRWPPGLLTLETRQRNRRLYERYLCRRVPGRQAVLVMARENTHMPDDAILEPGLVMIFAHGVE